MKQREKVRGITAIIEVHPLCNGDIDQAFQSFIEYIIAADLIAAMRMKKTGRTMAFRHANNRGFLADISDFSRIR